ncbi:1-(5-phosphoribosyl)-5-((5-phosphoribosylamino)methylideneamino) imidazole-4-carboxamide isomerase [uncultured Alphaproteobacteria bacterium]|uniref:1-(5-phosphoribosyl)-5-[(5-phosphoribosylamino)methylideneamino] imidazole-4-carboxamide isomerase n=1 Tax=uncultured Alphaproteobacteria bacterium TaxID=91750 RepID=A0A212KAZ3_9PROT|nr:1-(5-phosphoribosyl)-5-((5-phosphoribosylamino)methylideneamino) imidazole-4-carboxamide isomerase [uncultured Alphaproteobacteria bacterium]
MILFPAIDLKDGVCVRLYKGEMTQATVFNASPADQAARFVVAGCRWLHVVDLNGAFAGRPVNADAVAAILAVAHDNDVEVQLGGGIRDMATIEDWLGRGVSRVILGTAALRDPQLVKDACRLHPGRIAVGIDARDGRVAVEGWAETSEVTAEDLALRFADAGVSAIVHTDISRDGALQGANVAASARLAEACGIPVIVSGGVAGLADIAAVAATRASGVAGAIAGRALYDGKLDLVEACKILAAA